MTAIDILHERIERGYRLTKDANRRPILHSARQLLEAAAVTGTGLTLNPEQAKALFEWLDYNDAARALGMREAGKVVTDSIDASVPAAESNIVPFPRETRPNGRL